MPVSRTLTEEVEQCYWQRDLEALRRVLSRFAVVTNPRHLDPAALVRREQQLQGELAAIQVERERRAEEKRQQDVFLATQGAQRGSLERRFTEGN